MSSVEKLNLIIFEIMMSGINVGSQLFELFIVHFIFFDW